MAIPWIAHLLLSKDIYVLVFLIKQKGIAEFKKWYIYSF